MVRVRRPSLISSSVRVTFFQVLVHQFFGGFSSSFDHLFAPLLGRFHQSQPGISSYSNFMPWEASSQMMAFIFSRSTTPWKLSSAPIGITIGTGLAFRRSLHLVDNLEEVGTGTVHLVHEGQTRHLVLVGLTPHGFRLGLHATHGAVHHAGTVQHAHGTLHLNGEVHVAGGVDDVEAVLWVGHVHALPEAGHGSRGDR